MTEAAAVHERFLAEALSWSQVQDLLTVRPTRLNLTMHEHLSGFKQIARDLWISVGPIQKDVAFAENTVWVESIQVAAAGQDNKPGLP